MSSSYLGHGAKYWADRYFESQTQTRMPDNFSAIEWRDKYLNLEKSCALYQAKIADLRTEVEDLRQKAPSEPEPELFEGHTVDYWFNKYAQVARRAKEAETDSSKSAELSAELQRTYAAYWKATDALREKNDLYEDALVQIDDLKKRLAAVSYKGHDIVYWYDKSEDNRITSDSFKSALDEAKAALTCKGHDAKYWCQLAHQQGQSLSALQQENQLLHQKNYNFHQKKNFYLPFQTLLIAISIVIVVFSGGLLLGEGYFTPYFTPSSPFINEIQESSHLKGYENGVLVGQRRGKREGFSDGYNSGIKQGYLQGYSDHIKGLPSAYSTHPSLAESFSK